LKLVQLWNNCDYSLMNVAAFALLALQRWPVMFRWDVRVMGSR
jgi:hypothetical protein